MRTLAPRSYDDYWSKARMWIIPKLGKHRLDRLQPEQLDALYTAMIEAGTAPSHVLKVHRILSRALEVAVRRGKVARNVARLVDPPSSTDVEIAPLDETEARKILRAPADLPNAARWSVGLALGLRQGEALGLRWAYLDLDAGVVKVWWQLQRLKWRHGCDDAERCGLEHKPAARARLCPERRGGGLVFQEPKGKSKRIVPP